MKTPPIVPLRNPPIGVESQDIKKWFIVAKRTNGKSIQTKEITPKQAAENWKTFIIGLAGGAYVMLIDTAGSLMTSAFNPNIAAIFKLLVSGILLLCGALAIWNFPPLLRKILSWIRLVLAIIFICYFVFLLYLILHV